MSKQKQKIYKQVELIAEKIVRLNQPIASAVKKPKTPKFIHEQKSMIAQIINPEFAKIKSSLNTSTSNNVVLARHNKQLYDDLLCLVKHLEDMDKPLKTLRSELAGRAMDTRYIHNTVIQSKRLINKMRGRYEF